MKKAILMCLIVLMLGIAGGNAYAVRFPLPPPIILPIPPPLVVIPGTYVYAAPDPALLGLFFFDGFWYRQYENRWYRSPRYDAGRWMYMRDRDVPMGMRHIPPDYHDRIQGREHLRYDDVNRNWRGWRDNHRWERDPGWRGEHGGPGGHDGGSHQGMPSGGHERGGPTGGGNDGGSHQGAPSGGHDRGGGGHDHGDKDKEHGDYGR